MKLASRYNRLNIVTSLVVLLITGIIYYVVIHFILTKKLDRDLVVEENEIKQYVATYHKLPLAISYLDQQVFYRELAGNIVESSEFKNTFYYNKKEEETEPGRSLITVIYVNKKPYEVTISKSRIEAEDLVRIILIITVGVTCLLLLSLILINRLVLNRLWRPFYSILTEMKSFNLVKMNEISQKDLIIDEFKELNTSASAMAISAKQDYKELKTFTDNASHEMMTPLAVINSKMDTLLQNGTFSKEQGVILEDIYHAIGRLSRLHQSLLLLSKIENKLISDVQQVDFEAMIISKIKQFAGLLEKESINVTLSLENVQVFMSRYLADILLNNLIVNSIKHNYKSGSSWINLKPGCLQVINTGKIAVLNPQVFDRFFKSDNSEGMGLGLAISRQICVLYGYSIEYSFSNQKHIFEIKF